MLEQTPIGEVILKNIDRAHKHCTLGISMQSDAYKNKGYGTQAEKLTLKYAFAELGMEKVLADALVTNTRSQHVLEKVGFVETHRDESFVYYKCNRAAWMESQYAAGAVKLSFASIIAHLRSKRNKIFILLRLFSIWF